jgi:DNA-binding SARP family transcriptional activator
MSGLRIQLLGPVRVWRDGVEVTPAPAQQRAVLAVLALAVGRPVRRERLVVALWADQPPRTAWNVVQTHVKRLRSALEPGRQPRAPSAVLPRVGDGYALRVDPECVDLARFRRLAGAARDRRGAGDNAGAWALLDEALALWQAEPLADVPPLADRPVAAALAEERWQALGWYGEAALALGRAAETLPSVEEAALARPLDERAQARLVRAYHAVGRRADAFATYHETRRRLAETLGVDPGPDLRRAHEAVLREGGR